MKEIRYSCEIILTLNVGTNKRYDVIAIYVIQFIVCNCTVVGSLCNRKGGYNLNMNLNGMCRDCGIKLFDDGNTRID